MENKNTTIIDEKTKEFEFLDALADSLWSCYGSFDDDNKSTEPKFNNLDEFNFFIETTVQPKLELIKNDNSFLSETKSQVISSVNELNNIMQQKPTEVFDEEVRNQFKKEFKKVATPVYKARDNIEKSIDNLESKLNNIKQDLTENSQKLETSQPIKTEINQETAETMYDETLGNEEWLKLHDMHPHSQFEDSDTDLVVDAETMEDKNTTIIDEKTKINQETAETLYDETFGNEEWLMANDMHPHSQFEDIDDDLVVDKELLKYIANEIVDKLENYNNKVVDLEPLKLDLNLIDATPENFAQRVEEIFVNVDIDKMNVINDFLKSVKRDIFDKSPFEDIGDDLNHDVAYDLNTCVADVSSILESDYVAENSQKLETSQPIKTENVIDTNNQEQVPLPEVTVNNQYANVINSIGEKTKINQEIAEIRYDETIGNEEWLMLHDMHPHSQREDSDTDLVVDKELLKYTANEIVDKLKNYNNKVVGLEPLKLDLNLIDATPENFEQRVEEIFVNVDIDKMNVINDFLKSVENDIFDKSPFEYISDDSNYDVACDLNTTIIDVIHILDSDYVAENSQKLETSQPIKTENVIDTNNQEQVPLPEVTVNNQYANVINSIGEMDNIANDTDKVMIRVDVVNELLNILKDKDSDSHKSLETVASQISNLENTLKSALTELESIKENLPQEKDTIENSISIENSNTNSSITETTKDTQQINQPINETISSINEIQQEVAEIKQQYVIELI